MSNSFPNVPVDVNKPVQNPVLRKRLDELAQSPSPEAESRMLEEIALRAHFLSVVTFSEPPKTNADGTATIQKDTMMNFPVLTATDDRTFYPAFTDWSEVHRWNRFESPQTVIFSFDDYAAMVLENEEIDGITINAFHDNIILDRNTIQQIKEQKEKMAQNIQEKTFTEETEVLIGDPKPFPSELVRVISTELRNDTSVKQAWLRMMICDDEKSYLIIVDFEGEHENLFGRISRAAMPYLGEMGLNMAPYDSRLGKQSTDGIRPFYFHQ